LTRIFPGRPWTRATALLLLGQIGGEFCLVANLDLIDRHGNEFIANAEKAAPREDHCRYGRVIKPFQAEGRKISLGGRLRLVPKAFFDLDQFSPANAASVLALSEWFPLLPSRQARA
jgi:hypothetical protein